MSTPQLKLHYPLPATNSVKLRELMDEKEEAGNELDEKMERWVYLNDLNEKIQNADITKE